MEEQCTQIGVGFSNGRAAKASETNTRHTITKLRRCDLLDIRLRANIERGPRDKGLRV